MNILAPTRARLQIEVVFDLVCPWCYLGVHRLRRTLRRRLMWHAERVGLLAVGLWVVLAVVVAGQLAR